jgi:hypothetical protein
MYCRSYRTVLHSPVCRHSPFIMRICWSLNVNPLNHITQTCNSFVQRSPFTQFSLTTPTLSSHHVQTVPYVINHSLVTLNNVIIFTSFSSGAFITGRVAVTPINNEFIRGIKPVFLQSNDVDSTIPCRQYNTKRPENHRLPLAFIFLLIF